MNWLRTISSCFAVIVCFSNAACAQQLIQDWDDRSSLRKVLFSESAMGIGSFAGAGTPAVYDLNVDRARTSESAIFRTNFARMNAIGTLLLANRYNAGDFKNGNKFTLTYATGSRGGGLFLKYRF